MKIRRPDRRADCSRFQLPGTPPLCRVLSAYSASGPGEGTDLEQTQLWLQEGLRGLGVTGVGWGGGSGAGCSAKWGEGCAGGRGGVGWVEGEVPGGGLGVPEEAEGGVEVKWPGCRVV